MAKFDLKQEFQASTDQRAAIDQLSAGIVAGASHQTLLGVTGSGKTFTMASIIAKINRPTLILTHNKTLAAQLYGEFKEFFPNNAVEYFVSYYDYYQPEAYVPRSDLYIEKDSAINENLDKLRLSATRSLFDREDVVIISSVSCIYGLGSPEAYANMLLYLGRNTEVDRSSVIRKLVEIRYERNEISFFQGKFRVKGDTLDIFPAYDDVPVRILFDGDEIVEIFSFDSLTGNKMEDLSKLVIYPASHYVQPKDQLPQTLQMIRDELKSRLEWFHGQNKLLEAQRLDQRTRFDLEMLEETGVCTGIENYSRIMTRRSAGQAPPTLIDYFPPNSLLFVDESHVTIPQIHGMYKGDRSRKTTLVDYGFRLPSALDNRPLMFEEFEKAAFQLVFVSATPGDYEIARSENRVVEQLIRPTGLLDPEIFVRPSAGQIDDLYAEILLRVEKQERVLVTTLTKKMAESLTDYLLNLSIKVRYMHSDIDTIKRSEILRSLRLGEFDVLVGINLLREGLDIPEVSLVAILDADKEGFLRSSRSLIQICGRAARNQNGLVIMYADQITRSMQETISETNRRRQIQFDHNTRYNITPRSIIKKIQMPLVEFEERDKKSKIKTVNDPAKIAKEIVKQRGLMQKAAKKLAFEEAAAIRDKIKSLENRLLGLDDLG